MAALKDTLAPPQSLQHLKPSLAVERFARYAVPALVAYGYVLRLSDHSS